MKNFGWIYFKVLGRSGMWICISWEVRDNFYRWIVSSLISCESFKLILLFSFKCRLWIFFVIHYSDNSRRLLIFWMYFVVLRTTVVLLLSAERIMTFILLMMFCRVHLSADFDALTRETANHFLTPGTRSSLATTGYVNPRINS